jgi:hypothetical protein
MQNREKWHETFHQHFESGRLGEKPKQILNNFHGLRDYQHACLVPRFLKVTLQAPPKHCGFGIIRAEHAKNYDLVSEN